MSEIVAIEAVYTAEGEKNGRQWKRWDVKLRDGRKVVTFKAPVGNAAQTFHSQGQPVEVDISERAGRDGGTDYMLDAVRPAPEQPAGTDTVARVQAAAVAHHAALTGGAKDMSIVRQLSWKATAWLLQGQAFTKDSAADLAHFIEADILRDPSPPTDDFGDYPF